MKHVISINVTKKPGRIPEFDRYFHYWSCTCGERQKFPAHQAHIAISHEEARISSEQHLAWADYTPSGGVSFAPGDD